MITPGATADPLRPMRDMDRAQLEALASGIPGVMGGANPLQAGQARYELLVRDREYAEQQEKSRREFETALADKQLTAAANVAWATQLAMWAAVASGISAVIQAVIAIHHW
jgi:hypothetical protein